MRIIGVHLKEPTTDGLLLAVVAPIASFAIWAGAALGTALTLWSFAGQAYISTAIFTGFICHAFGVDALQGWRPILLMDCAIVFAFFSAHLLLHNAIVVDCCGAGGSLSR